MDTKEADKKKFVKGATLGGFICFLLMGTVGRGIWQEN